MSRIVRRPSSAGPSMLGGSIDVAPAACEHGQPVAATPWTGAHGTAGRVAVVGAGKMGLPLAVQFAGHGWRVLAVDIDPLVVEAVNAGRSHVAEEPDLGRLVAGQVSAGRLSATLDGAAAAGESDVVVLIVPVMLDPLGQPDHRQMDGAVDTIGPGVHRGSLVVFETTLPVGDTRTRYVPRLERLSGLAADRDFFVAFSPERLYSGSALRNLATYPKLVGGIGEASGQRAAAFYASVLDTEIVHMASAEAAEFAKLADTTYRDVNIALANEFARYADRVGVDVLEVIAAANSQPYSHIHQPGIGVGGHCIPVYPRFLLARAPDMELVAASRRINDGQVDVVVGKLHSALGGLDGAGVLVLGLTYRAGVKELAYSRAIPLVARLNDSGAQVRAYDPLLTADDVAALGATPWAWGARAPGVAALVSQTEDRLFATFDPAWTPDLRVVVDGRNSLRDVELPDLVAYHGVGVGQTSHRPSPVGDGR